MSRLSYRSSPDNGLSFDLLVDGVALGEVLADGNEGIPYWIVEDDLPYWPPHGTPRDADYRIVTVCSCGEYGCGHSRCHVTKTADSVTFHGFTGDVGADGMARVFTFPRSDYDQTVSGIVAEARRQGEKEANNKGCIAADPAKREAPATTALVEQARGPSEARPGISLSA